MILGVVAGGLIAWSTSHHGTDIAIGVCVCFVVPGLGFLFIFDYLPKVEVDKNRAEGLKVSWG
jgi:hypothetical protein